MMTLIEYSGNMYRPWRFGFFNISDDEVGCITYYLFSWDQ